MVRRHWHVREQWRKRVLNDGRRLPMDGFTRYFTRDGLLEELGGVRTLFAGCWFVAVGAWPNIGEP